MGARIARAGTSVIEIEGVGKLGSIAHRIIGDRVEAGTFLIAGAALGGELEGHLGRVRGLGAGLPRRVQGGAGRCA